jgi:hypothetical protein
MDRLYPGHTLMVWAGQCGRTAPVARPWNTVDERSQPSSNVPNDGVRKRV